MSKTKQKSITSIEMLTWSLAAWNTNRKADRSSAEAFYQGYLNFKAPCGEETVHFITDHKHFIHQKAATFDATKERKVAKGLPYGPCQKTPDELETLRLRREERKAARKLKKQEERERLQANKKPKQPKKKREAANTPRSTTWVVPKDLSYTEYLQSDHWQALRQRLIAKKKCCSICGSTDQLNIHHNTYRDQQGRILGREKNSQLSVLCGRCHALYHSYFKQPALCKQFFKSVRRKIAHKIALDEAFRLSAREIDIDYHEEISKEEDRVAIWRYLAQDIPMSYYLERDEE
jgi:hypothetical protein